MSKCHFFPELLGLKRHMPQNKTTSIPATVILKNVA